MKMVIDIDEDIYNHIKNNYIVFNGMRTGKTFMAIIYNAIGKGIPLPKGHGRLIDADALEVSMADDWHTANEIASCIKYAPTIIKADKESD